MSRHDRKDLEALDAGTAGLVVVEKKPLEADTAELTSDATEAAAG